MFVHLHTDVYDVICGAVKIGSAEWLRLCICYLWLRLTTDLGI